MTSLMYPSGKKLRVIMNYLNHNLLFPTKPDTPRISNYLYSIQLLNAQARNDLICFASTYSHF